MVTLNFFEHVALMFEPGDRWLPHLLFLQTFIVGVLCAILVGIRIQRIFRDAKLVKIEPLYINWILSSIADPHLPILRHIERAVMRDLIVKLTRSLEGIERTQLITLYKHMGFLNDDHAGLTKRFGEKLESLARLEVMRDRSSIVQVAKLRTDPSLFVRLAGTRFLLRQRGVGTSAFLNEILAVESLDLDELVRMKRYDTLREFLDLLGRFEIQSLIRIIKENTDRGIRRLALETVISNRIAEAMPAVRQSLLTTLKTDRLENVDFCVLHIDCLALVADPENESMLRTVIQFATGALRAHGVKGLLQLRPDLKPRIMQAATKDDSPEMQRLVDDLLPERAA